MENRIKKAVITKRIRKYLRKGLKVVKISYADFSIFITPGSDRMMIKFNKTEEAVLNELLFVPKFSDYIVENNMFDSFIITLNSKLGNN